MDKLLLKNYFIPFSFTRTALLWMLSMMVFVPSCRQIEVRNEENLHTKQSSNVWFRQAVVDLGARIQMLSPSSGFAVSRGRGQNVPGRAYQYKFGQWLPILNFPYSDSPLIASVDTNALWIVNHLVHAGNCRPVFHEWINGVFSENPLPKIMWDQTDFVMWKGISRVTPKKGWMVGQQGHILTFDGLRWNEESSPLISTKRSNMYESDLSDINMFSSNYGWAVGRDGIILCYENGQWRLYESPTRNDLFKIDMVNERHGWIVGDKGTVLKFDGERWQKVSLDIRTRLTSVKAIDSMNAWIVGNNSTLLSYHNNGWVLEESIKTYNDNFADVDVKIDSFGKFHVWIIGDGGIYTNSQSLGFSFTDITTQASLRRDGRAGIFFDRAMQGEPDLLILGEDGPNLLFSNDGNNIFSEATLESRFINTIQEPQATAIGDVNNDGTLDILELSDQSNFRLFCGIGSGRFRDATKQAQFRFREIALNTNIATTFC